jgi:hypothetical protein
LTSAQDFDVSLREAERELREAQTADDVRRIWRKHFEKLGHRSLGRLLTGLSAAELQTSRKTANEED